MTNQKQFSLWGVVFLLYMWMAGLLAARISWGAPGVLRPLVFVGGILLFLSGMAVFSKFDIPYGVRLRGAFLLWVGGGLILGVLYPLYPFLRVGAGLLVVAFLVDAVGIGFLLTYLPENLRLAGWLTLSPLAMWLLPLPFPLQDFLLGAILATSLNGYWLSRWYMLYREPCRAEQVMHMAVNLTAVWLYHLWQVIWSLDETVKEISPGP